MRHTITATALVLLALHAVTAPTAHAERRSTLTVDVTAILVEEGGVILPGVVFGQDLTDHLRLTAKLETAGAANNLNVGFDLRAQGALSPYAFGRVGAFFKLGDNQELFPVVATGLGLELASDDGTVFHLEANPLFFPFEEGGHAFEFALGVGRTW